MISCAQAGLIGLPQGFQVYAASDKQYKALGTLSGTSPLNGASPAVVPGTIWVLDRLATPGNYTVTATSGGDFTIAAGADENRQQFAHDAYNFLLRAYYGAGTIYVNNHAPNLIAGDGTGLLNGQIFKKDQNQGTISLASRVEDEEGDSFNFTLQSGALPTGWSLASNGNVTGTPTVYGTYSYTIRITDAIGDYLDVADYAIIGDEIPDVEGDAEATATSTIEAVANFTVATPVSGQWSPTVTLGLAVRTDPPAGSYAPDDQEVTLYISTGAAVVTQTFIDENEAIRPNLTGISVLIWRAEVPSGAPDSTLTSQTTDSSGVTEWKFDPGALETGDRVFFVAFSGSPPDNFTASSVIPTLPE